MARPPDAYGMLRPVLRALGSNLLVFALLVGWSVDAYAAGAEPTVEVTPEQLAYSKRLYAEGVDAMKAKRFDLAFTKFEEAYRYAPHLHLFNFNLASAADGKGDCKRAQDFYRAFLDLVPSHPERKTVERRLKTLQVQCPYDPDSEALLTSEDRARRDDERQQELAGRALNDALFELRRSIGFYSALQDRFPTERTFRRAERRRKRDEAQMTKLILSLSVEVNAPKAEPPTLPDSPGKACRTAKAQEKRSADRLQRIYEHFDASEIGRTLDRVIARTGRDADAFDACAS